MSRRALGLWFVAVVLVLVALEGRARTLRFRACQDCGLSASETVHRWFGLLVERVDDLDPSAEATARARYERVLGEIHTTHDWLVGGGGSHRGFVFRSVACSSAWRIERAATRADIALTTAERAEDAATRRQLAGYVRACPLKDDGAWDEFESRTKEAEAARVTSDVVAVWSKASWATTLPPGRR